MNQRVALFLGLILLLWTSTPALAAPVVTGTVSWSYNAAETQPVTTVKVMRRIGTTGAFALVGSVTPPIAAFVDTGLALGTQYCYQVVPANVAGDGPAAPPPPGACATVGAPPTLPVNGVQVIITITP